MVDRGLVADGRVDRGDRRLRRWRDWLIASGSVIWFVGVAFPLYLAWRDGRRRWLRVCGVLVVASVASVPMAATAATSTAGAALELVAWLAGVAAAIALAATAGPKLRRAGPTDRTWAARIRSPWESLYALGAGIWAVVVLIALVLVLLMLLGLAIRELSQLLGMPLPYVRDDASRVEWGGLAELVGYGVAGAVALYLLAAAVKARK